MPRYDTNMANVVANFITLLPKGHYRFKVLEPKAFASKEQKDGIEVIKNYGVRYPVEVVEVIQGDASIGDRQMVTCYQHSEGARSFSKGQHMVLCGFDQTADGQKAYNEKFATADFTFDSDSGEVGDGWKAPVGSLFEAVVSISKQGDNENQKWDKLIPFQG